PPSLSPKVAGGGWATTGGWGVTGVWGGHTRLTPYDGIIDRGDPLQLARRSRLLPGENISWDLDLMMRVDGILETALYVADIKRSAEFYRNLFGFNTLVESERLIALDVAGRNVLLLFLRGGTSEPFATPGGVIPPHSGSGQGHFAFAISAEDIEPWQRHLESKGVTVESVVSWPGGAQTVYFRDPDAN